ncbi:MAG: hypothetical protein PHC44_12125 [Lutispora sp.]|nr:hypothetical protein [Lutispora sp.]MDD4835446.1 hypothetical protein [Lutispora sp.]
MALSYIISIVVVLEVVIVLLGLYGKVLFPELTEPDMTIMTMMKQMLSPIGAGITLSALAAAMMSTMDSLLLYPAWGVLGLTFAAAFYGGLYWKRFNAPGIITAMIAGSVTFVAWHLMGNPLGIYHIQAALIVSIPLTIIVTYMTPPTSDKVLAQFFDANTNSKSASMN